MEYDELIAELLTRYFALCGVCGDAFDIYCVRRMFRHTEFVLTKHGLDVLNDAHFE